MVPQRRNALVFGICEYIILMEKQDCIEVIQVSNPEMRESFWIIQAGPI